MTPTDLSNASRLFYFMAGAAVGVVLFLLGVWTGWRRGLLRGLAMAEEEQRRARWRAHQGLR